MDNQNPENHSDALEDFSQMAKLKVVGVGGGGGNAVNAMIEANVTGVEFLVANTDVQALKNNKSINRIQIGRECTKGLGAGANPNIGKEAAEETRDELKRSLQGADLVFIAAGMGGGTGTGAAPVIAEVAKEVGALTVGIVTKPFAREGRSRTKKAEDGANELQKVVDSLVVIPNDRLLAVGGKNTPILDAFRPCDDVLRHAVQGISDLITTSGMINVDFADVRTIMTARGNAMMGIGRSTDAAEAAETAIASPLLEDIDISGAKGVLVNVTGSSNMTMEDFDKASSIIHDKVHEDANIIIGLVINEDLGDEIQVTAIATGFGNAFERDFKKSKKILMTEDPARLAQIEKKNKPPVEQQHFTPPAPIQNEDRYAMSGGNDDKDWDVPAFLRKRLGGLFR